MAVKADRKAYRNGKTPPKTPMRVPAHGNGKLLVGNPGNAGNRMAMGPPPSVIRERCRGSFADRIPVLESIADGDPMERIEVPLLSILTHAECPKCHSKLVAKDDTSTLVTVTGRVSARAGDRTKAVGELGKYGLGDATGMDIAEVRAKLARTLDLIESICPAPLGKRLLEALKPVWDH